MAFSNGVARSRWHTNTPFALFALIAIVFLSRVPFLDAGYGANYDGWLVAITARDIAISGQYRFSRPPGHPVQEILYSFVWQAGPFAFNAITASMSAIAVLFFSLSVKTLGCKDYLVAGFALAFAPVIFVNSTHSIDYLWALALILASLYFVLIWRPVTAGIFLGLAIGCRITSGAALFPLAFLFWRSEARCHAVRCIVRFVVGACFVGALAFIPVLFAYGLNFWTFTEGSRPAGEILSLATEEVWGRLGTLALLLAAGLSLFSRNPQRFIPSPSRISICSWTIGVALYTVAFLRLPHLSAYLIPAVPFVLLLLGNVTTRKVFIIMSIALTLSSFISFGRTGLEKGLLFTDYEDRVSQIKSATQIIDFASSLREKSVIVVGKWLPVIKIRLFPYYQGVLMGGNEQPLRYGEATFVYEVDQIQLPMYLEQGLTVYYLSLTRQHAINKFRFDPLKNGARLAIVNGL